MSQVNSFEDISFLGSPNYLVLCRNNICIEKDKLINNLCEYDFQQEL
jgi:hypothetical protein